MANLKFDGIDTCEKTFLWGKNMSFSSFKDWHNWRESRESELKCPHPNDKEYCRDWNLWIKGELSSPPEYKAKKSLGHWTGPKAGVMQSKKEKARKDRQKGGKYDWRKDS